MDESKFEICSVLNNCFIKYERNKSKHSYDTLLSENNIFNDSIFLKPIETEEITNLLAKIQNYTFYFKNDIINV